MYRIFMTIGLIIFSYFIGNIHNATLISKLRKKDVRQIGSGNPGAMNMFRNFGVLTGLITLILDALKGVVPCVLGWYFLGDKFAFTADKIGVYICGISIITGHIFPVLAKFKGGKGIASSIGVCFVINPLVTLISFAIGAAFILITSMGSVTSFIIISVPIIYTAFTVSEAGLITESILLFVLFILPLFAHRSNIIKLFRGTENKTVIIKRKKVKP